MITRMHTRRVGERQATATIPRVSDDDLASRFALLNEDRLRFVDAWGRWLSFDGTCWRHDEVRRHVDLVAETCRAVAANEMTDIDEARERGGLVGRIEVVTVASRDAAKINSARSVRDVLYLASASPRLAASPDDWDRDPYLLATPRGTVDLKTGRIRPNRPADLITMATNVAPDQDGSCKQWLELLNFALGRDADTIGFLQRYLGYSLTGSVDEHALLLPYGEGSNGKSTVFDIVAQIMGSYATTAPASMLMVRKHEEHSTEIARLRGRRLVTAQETEIGARLAEARVKQLTAGDVQSARLMRRDFVDFRPCLKLVLISNEKPRLTSVGEAMRRRMHLLHFAHTVAPEKREKGLATKIVQQEGPAILSWLIDGAREWCAGGLRVSSRVRAATDGYFSAEDMIGQWREQECELIDPPEGDDLRDLWASFTRWLDQHGHRVERSQTSSFLRAKLEAAGFQAVQHSRTRRFMIQGLKVKFSAAEAV